jgi:putative 2OG-Fe(II) oxygenase
METLQGSGRILDYVEALKKDGFVFFRNFFEENLVNRAFQEITSLYDAQGGNQWGNSERLIDIFGKAPAFDAMLDKFLTDPLSSGVLRALAGSSIKIRGYNIRRMDGSYDPAPLDRESSIPHEWHRDAKGEICISFLLTDVPGPDCGATALLPGSHLYPYCPKRELIFSKTLAYPGKKFFVKHNFFNQALGRKVFKKRTGAYGKKGDAYLFINDVWHGREANLTGHKSMISFVGAFPIDFPFPDGWTPPPDEVIDQLPLSIQKALRPLQNTQQDKPEESIIHWMYQHRQPPSLLFRLAKLERDITAKTGKQRAPKQRA